MTERYITAAAAAAKSLQACSTLCDPIDGNPPGSSVPGILQSRTLKCVAISFFRGSSQPRDRTHVSCIACGFFTSEPPGKSEGKSIILRKILPKKKKRIKKERQSKTLQSCLQGKKCINDIPPLGSANKLTEP